MVDEAKKPKTDHSRMSLERLKELCDEVFNDTNLEYSIANPLFGYMFKTDGCLESIRFFSSEIIAVYDENNSRDYSKDTSENSLTSLVILLFPSPLGVLNSARNTLSNFTNKYFIDNKDYDETSSTDSRNKNIKMLANTFIKLYKGGTSNELEKPGISEATPYKMFEYYVFAPSDVPGLENTNLKLLTIHAYALSVIDNTDEFRVYLETISEGLKDIENDRLECLVLSDQQKKEFKELYMNHSNFPYSKINQPVSNSSIPIYNRHTDEFSKTQKFSDCTDIAILHLCNCLFYNEQTGECSLANLKSESNISDECTRLIEFYEKYNNKPFNITYEMRMDWSRVVQGLSDNEAFEYQAKYKPYAIRYVNQEYRNEIVSGAISIINVLAKICNIEKIYKSVMTENAVMMYSLGKKLSYLFNKISSDQIEIVKIKGDDIREFEYKGIKDFSGKYEITFKLAPSADSVKMLLDVQNGHAELKFVSMDSNQMKDSLKDYDVKSGDMTLRSLLNRYVKMIKNRDEKTQNYDFSFEILYNQGPLQVDDQKIEQLICLYEYIDRQDNIDHSIIKRIIANIVKSADLSDQATGKLFIPFFIYIDDLLLSLDEGKIFDAWLHLYLNGTAIKSEVIRSLWNEQRGLKRMEVTSLTLPSPCIATDDMKMLLYSIRLELEQLTLTAFNKNPEELVDIVGSLLSYNSKLSELTIKENGLGSKDCADIFNVLKDNKTLRILDISYNNITSEYSEQIANALMVNNTLIILSISGNKLDNIGIRQLARGLMVNNGLLLIVLANSKLTDLGVRYICEALKSPSSTLIGISLFGNLITKKGAEYLADALKINQTLTTLDISNNPVGDEGLKHLSEALKTNKTLQKFLCLSCSITATGAKYISEALKTSTALTDLNIASNSLGDYGIWYISEALKLNQHLQLLKICNIGIKAPGVKYIAEALGKNRTLKVLDLSDISLDDEGLKYISESLKTNQTLSTLSICYMPMIGFGINYISDILKINKGIEKLDLSQVTLLDMNTNIKNFFDGIRMNITITELSICTKYLKPETSQLLFDALKVNTTIKSLRISQNGTFCKDFGSDLAKDAKEKDREILLCSF